MIPVHISKITLYPPSKGYAILLQENSGNRQLPVIIGGFEAQAIAFAIEKVEMPRPMTHDLIVNILNDLEVQLKYVLISDLIDGTFYARMRVKVQNKEIDIDSRPSDAIAVALRMKVPIFVAEEVMMEAGIERGTGLEGETPEELDEDESDEIRKLIQLQAELQKAIDNEEYEKAARIRDEIKKIEQGTKKE